MEFYEKLTVLRKENGYTQEQLAEQLGVSRQAVSRWEQGETMPEIPVLIKICEIFHISADYLLNTGIQDADIMSAPTQKDVNKKSVRKNHLFAAIAFTIGWLCYMISFIMSGNSISKYIYLPCIGILAFLSVFNYVKYFRQK